MLRSAQDHGAWIDVPFAEDLPEELYGLDRSRLVLSWHAFDGTPGDLPRVLARMRSHPAAAYKLVPTARDFPDALAILRLLERESRGDLCAFSMGAPGIPVRVLALAWGSCATYATAPGCEAAAPGQMALEEFLATYRPLDIRKGDPLYALAGWPLTYTKTPSFFNPWLDRSGLPGRYIPFPCTDPRDLLESGLPLRGVAVTTPTRRPPSDSPPGPLAWPGCPVHATRSCPRAWGGSPRTPTSTASGAPCAGCRPVPAVSSWAAAGPRPRRPSR